MDRDPGLDQQENLGLLEIGWIETSRPKRERSGQTSDTAADNYDAKRTRHCSHTLAVNRNHGPGDVAERLRLIRGNTWPMRLEELVRPAMACPRTIRCQPNTSTDEPCMTRHADGDCLLPEPWSVHYDFSHVSIGLKAVAFQYVFSTTLLYYTDVKFIQQKHEAEIQGESPQPRPFPRRPTPP